MINLNKYKILFVIYLRMYRNIVNINLLVMHGMIYLIFLSCLSGSQSELNINLFI